MSLTQNDHPPENEARQLPDSAENRTTCSQSLKVDTRNKNECNGNKKKSTIVHTSWALKVYTWIVRFQTLIHRMAFPQLFQIGLSFFISLIIVGTMEPSNLLGMCWETIYIKLNNVKECLPMLNLR